jgi:hypothetical protein
MALERNELAARFLTALLANPEATGPALSWLSGDLEQELLDRAFKLAEAFIMQCGQSWGASDD